MSQFESPGRTRAADGAAIGYHGAVITRSHRPTMPQPPLAMPHAATRDPAPATLAWSGTAPVAVAALFGHYGLEVVECTPGSRIPGSYWGESEAGLIGARLYVRPDTPLHSALHEACHWICMDSARRTALHTDAGGDDAEEDAVCYLQVLLADAIPELGRARMFADMDAWGYSFRLGAARTWFEQDAAEARDWLRRHGLTDGQDRPTGELRR